MFEDFVLTNADQNVPVSGVPIHTHLASNILSKDLAFYVTALFARSRAYSQVHSIDGSNLRYMPDNGMVSKFRVRTFVKLFY
jgi:hypothetical protein